MQLLADGAHVLLPVAQLRGGVPRHYAHARHLGECVNQLFGESVAEILVLGLAAEIGEGQHRHRDYARLLARRSGCGLARRFTQSQARRVAAGDELDEHRVGRAVAIVIGLEFGTQAARFHAHDRVHARIVGWLAVEYFHADQVFLQLVRLPGERALHRKAQESDHAAGAGKKLVRQDFFQLLPDCDVGKCG